MNIRNVRTRKAISPVLATVILIAITLVAGVAIAGFAFGLFGTLGTTANLSVKSAACDSTAKTATITVSNTGGANAAVTGATPAVNFIDIKSTSFGYVSATLANVPANTATAALVFDTAASGAGAISAGQTITGNLIVNGGANVPFTATCT